ncbi:hypothetical protein X975_18597, partial [Stegodyphus mimosarum]
MILKIPFRQTGFLNRQIRDYRNSLVDQVKEFPNSSEDLGKEFPNSLEGLEKEFPNFSEDLEKEFPNFLVDLVKGFPNSSAVQERGMEQAILCTVLFRKECLNSWAVLEKDPITTSKRIPIEDRCYSYYFNRNCFNAILRTTMLFIVRSEWAVSGFVMPRNESPPLLYQK